ncbi:adenylate kinase 7-like isoform X2 [Cynoglossus semilaevis]|uniref:adenylate kinase 7-like isoform X2 n=1 Tax=Cynoglossus semilaevis TaxID=244447 RepID=UPI000D627217|nr:adenylate kinase 7-like isoform X2 [Cynoglossus semilaevis]
MEESPTRVFINNVDSYSSRYIAEFLCDPTGKLLVDAEIDIEKDKVDLKLPGALQIVGTVSEKSDENRLFMLEEYFGLNRDELLPKLLESDVIIYNISQHEDQVEEAMWALTALHKDIAQFSGPKTFILISTVLTWVCIKPGPNELVFPFTDHDFLKRRPHPNFKPHYDLERMVVKVGKNDRSLFSTYVVVSGLQYGMGEQVFHYFFKTSWLGRENEIPVFGEGNNTIPTIHIVDLASVIHEVIKHQPEPYYLLAVDSAKNTMKEIVKAVATTLGPGKIQNKPFQEVYLTQDLSMLEIDSLRVNLRLDGVLVRELFEVNWRYESGLVTNIEQMVEEYRQIRGLEVQHCLAVKSKHRKQY